MSSEVSLSTVNLLTSNLLTSIEPTPAGFAALQRATADLEPPYAVIDLGALRVNAADMVRRASGKPIRVASKSVRCRSLTAAVLELDGYHGVLAFTLAEALWLAADFDDVFVGYPTTDRAALRRLAADEQLANRVALMVDCAEQLDVIADAVGTGGHELRICLDLDASLELAGGRVHLGARRSPLRSPEQARVLAQDVVDRPGMRLVGVMCYEAQIAGVGNNPPGSVLQRKGIQAMQFASARELRSRRAAVIEAVRAVAPLEFVNGGGTGSLESTAAEDAVTELGAGSGLYGPALFDTYSHFTPNAAAFFVMSVVRRPTPEIATVLGGGWIASGAAGKDRLPTPAWPTGLELTGLEGAGEVQTPLQGPGAKDLRIGDRIWFRHTKAGELCEHVNELHLVAGDKIVATVPTYRGEGQAFL